MTSKCRLIMAAQSTGRIGKSTVMETLCAYADAASIPYVVTDADAEHRTISDRDPTAAKIQLAEPDDLLRVFKRLGKKAPLELLDIPAQKTDFILDVLVEFKAIEIAAEAGIRLTILLFVADDAAAETSLVKVIQTCQDKVDYIVIKNPARFRSRHYDGSPLQKTLKTLGAKEITLPTITQSTLDELQRAKGKAGRWLSLAEATSSEFVNKYSQHEIQYFLSRMYTQWHEVRSLILPEGIIPQWEPAVLEPEESKRLDTQVHLPED